METKHAQLLFSNSWEDPQLLLEALGEGSGKRILSIAAAGDSSLSLLTGSPEEILAIDTNPFQLYLVELKKMAIKHLDRWEVLAFLGFDSQLSSCALTECIHFNTEIVARGDQLWPVFYHAKLLCGP